MQNNIVFNLDDIEAMQKHEIVMRKIARDLVEAGNHAKAADAVELADCFDVIRHTVLRMTQLLSKCPCCYEKPVMN